MKRVLVVDDDHSVREMLAELLRGEGYEVGTANNGFAAMAALRERLPDLMLLDLMMPEMDGFQVLNELALEEIALPIVVLSAIAGMREKEYAQFLGARRVLAKPFEVSELMAVIEAAMNPVEVKP